MAMCFPDFLKCQIFFPFTQNDTKCESQVQWVNITTIMPLTHATLDIGKSIF